MAARIPSHMKISLQKKPDMRASFVDQPGIEPRFSEPKSDVIAFIPLVKDAFFSKAGAKVLLFFDMTKLFVLFFEKNTFLAQKPAFLLVLVHQFNIIYPKNITFVTNKSLIAA